MSFKILSQVENHLLKRKEVELSVDSLQKATPSRKELKSELAKTLKTEEDLVIPLRIKPVSGSGHALVTAYIYNKKEEIPKSLTDLMEQRISGKKAATPAAPAPAK
ncbi:MAG TPA: hypothetical protein VJA47_01465 [archaeon]|nr:hypothetical protein [archaeon]